MKIEMAISEEINSRSREIQLLINILEPDPEYQPVFISDEACLQDVLGIDEHEIAARLQFYFKRRLSVSLYIPIWQFIDHIKLSFPGWAEDWPPEHPHASKDSKDGKER